MAHSTRCSLNSTAFDEPSPPQAGKMWEAGCPPLEPLSFPLSVNSRKPVLAVEHPLRLEPHPPPAISCVSMTSLGILLSGRGSNFIAIADNIASGKLRARITAVISNRPDAPGIAEARARGLNALVIPSKGLPREAHDRAVAQALRDSGASLVILAGYLRLLSPWFVQQFPSRILNIHPSLLPAFPGLDAQRQALDYGVQFSGCTVHFVDEHLDHGAIILQKVVPVLSTDDDHALAARILAQEHLAYSEAIALVASGNYKIEGRRILPITGNSTAKSSF